MKIVGCDLPSSATTLSQPEMSSRAKPRDPLGACSLPVCHGISIGGEANGE